MRTIKLVVVGDSGVGKTSLRTQYISGRFATGYRATIGADFMAKTLPHYSIPDELVSLQIWDTAGQERFSSLSTAFFRGADAVILVFDVNKPETLQSLKRWWSTFQEYAPVPENEAYDYCCVVVGNKMDLFEATLQSGKPVVSESDARMFVADLIPAPSAASPPLLNGAPSLSNGNPHPGAAPHEDEDENDLLHDTRSASIDIRANHHPMHSRSPGSRATSRTRYGGTMNTSRTVLSIYHTPSSSLYDQFISAPSSPPPDADGNNTPPITLASRVPAASASSSSLHTLTPSFFTHPARAGSSSALASSASSAPPAPPPPAPPPERGARLFLTSAKSAAGVADIFAYVSARVVTRCEWLERTEALRDASDEDSELTVRLGREARPARTARTWGTCCA